MNAPLHFDIGLALVSVYDADGFLSVQYDAEGEQNSGVVPYEAHHPLGFMARPLDATMDSNGHPDPERTCNLKIAMEGGRGHAWVLEDPRVVPNLPTLKPGESMQYGCAGQFIRCYADGSIKMWTSDLGGAPGGHDIFFTMSPKDGFAFSGPWGTLRFDASGFRVMAQDGSYLLNLGSISGLPAPFDAITSRFTVQAGAVDVQGTMVSVGDAGPTPMPAAKATPLLAYLAEIAAALQAAATALASASAVSTSGITPAQSVAFQALVAPLLVPPAIASNTAV